MTLKLKKHETFYIRDGWFEKALNTIEENEGINIFFKNDGVKYLGIGANMVKGLKYWLKAAGLIDDKSNKLTSNANIILENDRYLGEDFTWFFIHYCLSNFIMSKDGFAYIKMTRDVIEKFGVSDETAASMVSAISTIEGCPVWAMFIEYPNEIRIRLRSRGPVINLLAEKYGGGGHPKAAGAHLDCWDDLDKFVLDANNLVKEYKKQ